MHLKRLKRMKEMKHLKHLKHVKRMKRDRVLSRGFRGSRIPKAPLLDKEGWTPLRRTGWSKVSHSELEDEPLLTRGPPTRHSAFRLPHFLVFCFFRVLRVRGNAANNGNTANIGNIANNGNAANIWSKCDEWDRWDRWNKRPGLAICDIGFGTLDLHLRIVNC